MRSFSFPPRPLDLQPRRALLAAVLLSSSLFACGGRSELFDRIPPPAPAPRPDASVPDAGHAAPPDASTPAPDPRLVAPLSTSKVSRHRPTLRWVLPHGVDQATVDLCLDRACTRPIGVPTPVAGTRLIPASDLPVGVVFWRVHAGAADGPVSPTWQLTVGAGDGLTDTSWGTTLDINGDGFADVAVIEEPDGVGSLEAEIYLGGAAGLESTPSVVIPLTGTPTSTIASNIPPAIVIDSAGDVNGDGYADLAISTFVPTDPQAAGVSTAIYFGGPSGCATTPAAALTIPADVVNFSVIADGWFVGAAGDVDGDGYADLYGVVGGVNSDDVSTSLSVVYLGNAAGTFDAPTSLSTEVSVVNSGPWYPAPEFFAAGDLNGDGYGDILSSLFDPTSLDVYYGSARGLPGGPTTMVAGAFSGNQPQNATVAGDLNGDGYCDVLMDQFGSGGDELGLFLGSPDGLVPSAALDAQPISTFDGCGMTVPVGDVNGDGYDDLACELEVAPQRIVAILFGASLEGASKVGGLAVTVQSTEFAFGSAIAAAGDVNDDGYADVLIYGDSAFHLYLGSATGITTASATIPFGGTGG